MERILGRFPTIPEYYQRFINEKVDLISQPKQCCPFHKEDTPSFSYSVEREKWRCFGACACGGDVIDLHRKNYRLQTREDAEKSLRALFEVRAQDVSRQMASIFVDETKVDLLAAYEKACILANNPERWIALDYVMSKYPTNVVELQELVEKWS